MAVVVILDEPQGPVKYGGVIAAPVFAAIVRDTLYYLGVPPEVPRKARGRKDGHRRAALRSVPNLLRLTRAEARKILPAPTSPGGIGEGDYVMEQNPKAGQWCAHEQRSSFTTMKRQSIM